MADDTRVTKGGASADLGHNSGNMTPEEKLATHYHSKKDRVFVRAIQGEYKLQAELDRLRSVPRIRKAKDIPFVDGPQCFSRHYVEPKDGITQTFHFHLEEYAPGASSQQHGHVNEAAVAWQKKLEGRVILAASGDLDGDGFDEVVLGTWLNDTSAEFLVLRKSP